MAKKAGVKKTKQNHETFVAAKQAEAAAEAANIEHFAHVATLDLVTIALGRLGFNEDDFDHFDEVMTEVASDYSELYHQDMKDDPEDMWYANDVRERELKQYVGRRYVPMEERYA